MGFIEEIKAAKSVCSLTDRDVIGTLFQSMDEGFDFVSGDNNYVWFYLIGSYFKPKVVVEMGSRFGYSMKCFVDGAGHPAEDYSLHSFDIECDNIQTLDIFEAFFRNDRGIPNIVVNRKNTKHLETLGLDGQADLCLVDADHSIDGCLRECKLGYASLRSGGVLVIDDTNCSSPLLGLQTFCLCSGLKADYLPSFRGISLIIKP